METQQSAQKRDVALALAAFMVALVLWQSPAFTPLVYPLRLFVTFIHELGHGIATLLTGGDFLRFEVKSSGAGLAYSNGGIRSIIIPAGYVGTALFGAILLYFTNRVRRPEIIAIILGIAFASLTILFTGLSLGNLDTAEQVVALPVLASGTVYFLVAEEDRGRWIGSGLSLLGLVLLFYWGAGDNALTVVVGILSGALLILVGYFGWNGHRHLTLFVLNFLAFVVGLNAITDARILFRIVNHDSRLVVRNDASAMANTLGLPATFWAGLWVAIAVILLSFSFWVTFIQPARRESRERTSAPVRVGSRLSTDTPEQEPVTR